MISNLRHASNKWLGCQFDPIWCSDVVVGGFSTINACLRRGSWKAMRWMPNDVHPWHMATMTHILDGYTHILDAFKWHDKQSIIIMSFFIPSNAHVCTWPTYSQMISNYPNMRVHACTHSENYCHKVVQEKQASGECFLRRSLTYAFTLCVDWFIPTYDSRLIHIVKCVQMLWINGCLIMEPS